MTTKGELLRRNPQELHRMQRGQDGRNTRVPDGEKVLSLEISDGQRP